MHELGERDLCDIDSSAEACTGLRRERATESRVQETLYIGLIMVFTR